MADQSVQLQKVLSTGGVEAAITAYLSPEHRDHPELGCASAALLPELGREAPDTRKLYTEHVMILVRQLAAGLSPQLADREGAALSIFASLIGTLQLARAVDDVKTSDSILAAGANAARALAQPPMTP